jgi:hypothetical protein
MSAIPTWSHHRSARLRPGRARLVRRLTTLGLVAAAVLACTTAPAPAAGPVVLPPVGPSYDALAVGWWQYVLSRPADTNPLSDPTGAQCANGQAGPVFFLAGGAGSATVTRTECVVRGPKALFFPLLNAFDVHTPGDGLDTPELTYKDFQTFGFRADTLTASVDGVPIRNLDPATTPFRACAAPVAGCAPRSFALALPNANLFGLPAGSYKPAVQDGYYLLLAPLSRGEHTITFGGTGNFGAPFAQDITYRLRVV